MKQFVSIMAGVLLATGVMGQSRVIQGKLTAFNAFPVINVEVIAKKAKTSAFSDSLGQFELVCLPKDVVIVKAKVFETAKKKIDSETEEVNFNLKFVNTKRNRQIAVGYGHMKEDDMTTAIQQYEQFQDEFCQYNTVQEAIVGKFSGVQILRGAVIIRGEKSVSGTLEALFVVDGFPTDDVSYLNPCLIKNISIIKDGSSAIYGSRGSAGVVLIETKKGGD